MLKLDLWVLYIFFTRTTKCIFDQEEYLTFNILHFPNMIHNDIFLHMLFKIKIVSFNRSYKLIVQ